MPAKSPQFAGELPKAVEAEMSLLGSMILDSHVIGEVEQILSGPSDFYETRHAVLYEVLVGLHQEGQRIDLVLLRQRLSDKGLLQQVGGVEYLLQLSESVPSAVGAPAYAKIVRDKAVRREALDVHHKIGQRLVDESTPLAEAISKSVGELTALPASDNGKSPKTTPVTVCLADVHPQPVRWLWPNRIPLGKVTLLVGDPKKGKSVLTLDIAARVTTGAGWPDAPGQRFDPGGVVLLSAEDDLADTIRPRLDAAGADVSRIVSLQAVEHRDSKSGAMVKAGFTLADLLALEAAIAQTPACRLVVIDPVSAYLAGADSHVNAEVRAALAPLAELAQRTGVAVLLVTHLRKGEGLAVYRAIGSIAFTAAARAVWAVAQDRDDPTGHRRLLLPVGCNLSADQETGLAFALRDNVAGVPLVAWEAGAVTISADDALTNEPRQRPGPA